MQLHTESDVGATPDSFISFIFPYGYIIPGSKKAKSWTSIAEIVLISTTGISSGATINGEFNSDFNSDFDIFRVVP